MTIKISEADYFDATENYMGWCPTCQAFTRESTEPDAEGYDCELCEGNEVVGAENAMISEMFEIV